MNKNQINLNEILLKWQIYPIKENPLKGIVVGIFILVVSIYSSMLIGNMAFLIIILIVLFMFVLLPYYLPTKFILTNKKVIIKNGPFKKEREWKSFRRFDYDKKMLKLFSNSTPSRLDNYRTLTLIFNQNNSQVIEIIKNKIKNEQQN